MERKSVIRIVLLIILFIIISYIPSTIGYNIEDYMEEGFSVKHLTLYFDGLIYNVEDEEDIQYILEKINNIKIYKFYTSNLSKISPDEDIKRSYTLFIEMSDYKGNIRYINMDIVSGRYVSLMITNDKKEMILSPSHYKIRDIQTVPSRKDLNKKIISN